jgi:trimeric autotransporter adhesin
MLPVGKGQMFLNSPSGFGGHLLDEAVGGWQVNYEQIIQNGIPLSIVQTDLSSSTYGTTSFGGAYQRPTYLGGDMHDLCYSGKPQSRFGSVGIPTPERPYFNTSLLTATLPYEYGNVPRSLPCRAPGADSASMSLNKTFAIHERLAFQFRAEALNVWNTPQFAGTSPGTYTLAVTGTGVNTAPTVNSTQTIGSNWTQIGFSRILQLGGRLTF